MRGETINAYIEGTMVALAKMAFMERFVMDTCLPSQSDIWIGGQIYEI